MPLARFAIAPARTHPPTPLSWEVIGVHGFRGARGQRRSSMTLSWNGPQLFTRSQGLAGGNGVDGASAGGMQPPAAF